MVFDRVRGDTQVRGDFLVAQASGDEPQHLELARGERAPLRDRTWRSRRDNALAHHQVGVLGSPDERDLPVSPKQGGHTAARHGVGEIEVHAQLHCEFESSRSKSGAGTASASPETIIAATPMTLPSTSAIGPPEFPGASLRSAWTQGMNGLLPRRGRCSAIPYPRGTGRTAWNTPTLTASFTPSGCPTANTRAPGRSAYGSPHVTAGTRASGAWSSAMSRSTSRPTTVASTARPSGVTTTAFPEETTCALVTNRSPPPAPPPPQAKPAPCPPSTIATTLARSRAAASPRNSPLGKFTAARACGAARRSPLRSRAVYRRARRLG